jgi:hypothetical protein
MMMSNQPEYENQQSETVTPEEVRQFLLAEIEANKQAIAELSDEQIEEVAGGFGRSHSFGGGHYGQESGMMVPGTGVRSGSGTGAMFKQAAIWTVGSTLATYGLGMVGSIFSGGGQQQPQQQQQNGQTY